MARREPVTAEVTDVYARQAGQFVEVVAKDTIVLRMTPLVAHNLGRMLGPVSQEAASAVIAEAVAGMSAEGQELL